jgi:mannose-6-phosphate isomerase-like protein (cupin superfamily)
VLDVSYAFGSLDDLGEGPGFRKIRAALGVSAFGINGIVMPPGHDGFLHFHDTQDELYFVHRGRVEVEVEGEKRVLGEGGLFHVEATTPRKVSNPFDEDAVLLAIGGKDGYVARDGHMVDGADIARRASFGKSAG